jgi:hypothetical protein
MLPSAASSRDHGRATSDQDPPDHIDPDYIDPDAPANNPYVRAGIARIVEAIDFDRSVEFGAGGLCLFRSLVALEAMRFCRIDATLYVGSLLYRVGPDPRRDVVAFCGPGNAGFSLPDGSKVFHTWLGVGDDLVDFSVGDWPRLDTLGGEIRVFGAPPLGPIQWTITPPQYWWRPSIEMMRPWRSVGTPALGEAWYGPYDGDVRQVQDMLQRVREDTLPKITTAVDQVIDHHAAVHNLARSAMPPPQPFIPVVLTSDPAAPPGFTATTMLDVWRLVDPEAVLPPGMRNPVCHVSHMPTTPEEALDLLRNLTVTAPPE